MRGKAYYLLNDDFFVGITPAYAGKRPLTRSTLNSQKDHPRLCGEKANPPAATIFRIGSPPPMRGKVSPPDFRNFITGITPAYAGKSIIHHSRRFVKWDHPRLCGEKPERSRLYPCREGSPPPMRGKALNYVDVEIANEDHPRLCGEKFSIRSTKSNCPGSPPPMRGKGIVLRVNARKPRITPAYAGKSIQSSHLLSLT